LFQNEHLELQVLLFLFFYLSLKEKQKAAQQPPFCLNLLPGGYKLMDGYPLIGRESMRFESGEILACYFIFNLIQ